MPLYTRSGGLLTRSGSLADNAACCCGSVIVPSCCGGASYPAPSSVSVTLTLGTRYPGFFPASSCSTAAAEALINGTYVLPFWFSGAGFAAYSLTTASGLGVNCTWWCNADYVYGAAYRMATNIQYCQLLAPCWQRVYNWPFYFGTGNPAQWGGTLAPNLCSMTPGTPITVTSSTAASGQTRIPLDTNLSTCSQNAGYSSDGFDCTVSVTTIW